MKKKKRLKKPIRIFIKTVVAICLLTAIGWSGYEIYKWGMERYKSHEVEKLVNNIIHEDINLTEKEAEEKPFEFTYDKWNKLHEMNNDFVGWLAFDDEFVSEPLVQAQDNDFYLRRNFNKQDDGEGTVFFDADNEIGANQNMTLYGHNVFYNQKAKLSPLAKLVDQEEYDKHNKFKIYFETYVAEYGITNVYYIDTSENNFNYTVSTFTEDMIEDYVTYANGINLIKPTTNLNKTSRFLTIQICKDDWSSVKIILNCKEINRRTYN